MAITELGGGGIRNPEDPEVRELPLMEEGETGQLIKTLAQMQFNQMKYGNPAGDRTTGGQGLPAGMSADMWSKLLKWFGKLFGIAGATGRRR